MGFRGWIGDVLGRRWSMIIPAAIGLFVIPTYWLTTDSGWIIPGFLVQSVFAGVMHSQMRTLERTPALRGKGVARAGGVPGFRPKAACQAGRSPSPPRASVAVAPRSGWAASRPHAGGLPA